MKRRKFIKLLGLALAIPLAAAYKPKSKGTFEPYVQEEDPKEEAFLYNGIKYPGKYEDYRTYLAEGEVWFISKDPTLFPNIKYSTLQNIRKWD